MIRTVPAWYPIFVAGMGVFSLGAGIVWYEVFVVQDQLGGTAPWWTVFFLAMSVPFFARYLQVRRSANKSGPSEHQIRIPRVR